MRTRIALVAIAPIAIITTIVLTQAATVESARGATTPPSGVPTINHGHRGAGRPATTSPARTGPNLLLDVNRALLARAAAAAPAPSAPAVSAPTTAAATATPAPTPPAGPVDSVTPAQRAAWERVALCEEGGNWQADSSRFSGGLGITRANWDLYGGREFASEGAMATEDQQIMVAERIQAEAPDQNGCRGW